MTDSQKKEFTEKLGLVIEETQKRIIELKELTKPIAPENAIGRVSRMDAINNKSINEAALRQAEAKLSKLKFATDKVDDPEFGSCVKCKEPIPISRLMLMPEAINVLGVRVSL